MMKKLLSILLAVLLIAALSGTAFAETGIGVEPGQAMPDFTVSLTDSTTTEHDGLVQKVKGEGQAPLLLLLPDQYAVGRIQVHAVTLGDAISLQKLLKLLYGCVDAQIVRRG